MQDYVESRCWFTPFGAAAVAFFAALRADGAGAVGVLATTAAGAAVASAFSSVEGVDPALKKEMQNKMHLYKLQNIQLSKQTCKPY